MPAFPDRRTKTTFPSADIATGDVPLPPRAEIAVHVTPVLLLIYGVLGLSPMTILVPFEEMATPPAPPPVMNTFDEVAVGVHVCPALEVTHKYPNPPIPAAATVPSNEHAPIPPYTG